MVEFSTSAILDGLIQLAAFLLTSVLIYILLRVVSRGKVETNFGLTLVVVFFFVVVKAYLEGQSWAQGFPIQAGVMAALSFLLIIGLLKPNPIVSLIGAAALVALGFGAEKGAAVISEKFIPEGPRFAEYMGLAKQAVEENKSNENLKSTDTDVMDVVRKGLDAVASLTEEEEADSMKMDFGRGMELFAERKEWMDSLSPEEKQAYREQMAAFLAEQGVAADRYSLAAIKDVEPTNMVGLVTLFSDLQNAEVEQETRIRSIPESLAQITANFGGFNLSDDDKAMLQSFAELFGQDEMDQAIGQARQQLEELEGDSEFMGTVLAAMVQADSGMPIDQFLAEEGSTQLLNISSLKSLASSHWKTVGKDPEEAWETSLTVTPYVEETVVTVVEEEVEQDPFIKVTTHLGVVQVPNDSSVSDEWIAAANQLKLRGFVSLGDEVVILCENGDMIRRGEVWIVHSGKYTYAFRVDYILDNRVFMHSDGRIWNQ